MQGEGEHAIHKARDRRSASWSRLLALL